LPAEGETIALAAVSDSSFLNASNVALVFYSRRPQMGLVILRAIYTFFFSHPLAASLIDAFPTVLISLPPILSSILSRCRSFSSREEFAGRRESKCAPLERMFWMLSSFPLVVALPDESALCPPNGLLTPLFPL